MRGMEELGDTSVKFQRAPPWLTPSRYCCLTTCSRLGGIRSPFWGHLGGPVLGPFSKIFLINADRQFRANYEILDMAQFFITVFANPRRCTLKMYQFLSQLQISSESSKTTSFFTIFEDYANFCAQNWLRLIGCTYGAY